MRELAQLQQAGIEDPVVVVLQYPMDVLRDVVHHLACFNIAASLHEQTGHTARTFQDILERCFIAMAL